MQRSRLLACAFAIAACLFLSASTAAASDEEQPLEWKKEWPKFRTWEVAATAGVTLQVVAAATIYNQPTRNWDGGILFDDAARSAFRLRTRDGRVAAATVSDMMYYGLLVLPAFDAPLTAGLRGKGEVALQTFAINWESFAVGGILALSFEKIGRTRPAITPCEINPSYDPRCDDKERLNTSFVSGHTTVAFTGAALMCAHHLHLPLYGGGAPDIAACVASISIASAQAILRVLSDNHYLTDVLLGSGVGLAAGYLLPTLLHYRDRTDNKVARSLLPIFRSKASGAFMLLAPTAGQGAGGAMLTGVF
jgi:membrane-associated phospholipid phosphatase